MNIPLLAHTLGCGVEAAALMPFTQAEIMLSSNESVSETVIVDEDFASYEIIATQKLDDPTGVVVELRILASDGKGQMAAFLYVGATGAATDAT